VDLNVLQAVLATLEHLHIKDATDIYRHLQKIETYQEGFLDPLAEAITFGAHMIVKV
jgi:hypothetical protein